MNLRSLVLASSLDKFTLLVEFRDVGIATYLTEVKDPVMDRLGKVGFAEKIGRDRIFLSTHQAMVSLGCL